jgi:hypothetical protein
MNHFQPISVNLVDLIEVFIIVLILKVFEARTSEASRITSILISTNFLVTSDRNRRIIDGDPLAQTAYLSSPFQYP